MRQRSLVVLTICAAFGAASLVAAPAAPAAAPDRWVAMGDSFQAGVGAHAFYPDSGECYRSPWSHPALLQRDGVLGGPFTFVACSGATTQHLYDGKEGEPPQFDALGEDVSHVTIGVSGNDMGFSRILQNCIIGSPMRACSADHEEGVQTAFDRLNEGTEQNTNRVQTILADILERAGSAKIFLLTYPKFFPDEGGIDGTSAVPRPARRCQMIRLTDQLWVNSWIQRLDNYLVTSATIFGAVPVDLYHAADDHELCSEANKAARYLNGIVPRPSRRHNSFHPTRYGYAQTACILKEAFLRPAPAARVAGDAGVTRQSSDVTVQPGQTVKVPVKLRGGGLGTGFAATWPEGDVKVRVLSPDGKRADAAAADNVRHRHRSTKRAVYDNVYVPGASGGVWNVELTGADQPTRVRVTATELARHKRPPQAELKIERTGPKTVRLDASGSEGSGGGPIKGYLWEFGDGTLATGRTVTHTFTKPGTFTVTLAVEGEDGQLGFDAAPPVTVEP